MKRTLTRRQKSHLLKHFHGWVATGFGSGLAPIAPGTAGSLVALVPYVFLDRLGSCLAVSIAAATLFVLGIIASDWMERRAGIHDAGAIVIDEWVGQWITLGLGKWLAPAAITLPLWQFLLAGFLLFRLFDVWKPGPVGWVDDRFRGGIGVMLDDLVAGVGAALALGIAVTILVRL